MHDLPTDWSALCALVFLLGLRHGFDADHLATIDGLTRLNTRRGLRFARHCGVLFSLGHGVVVLAIALGVGLLSERWAPPGWLEALGAWISIGFLLALGVLNLRSVLRAEAGRVVALVGLRAGRVARWTFARGPVGVAAVGALFALSFDTISQSALFAATAGRFGGVGHALLLGALFTAGMLVADGLNGWWIARLIARADRLAVIASRVMGVVVAGVSLMVAGLGLGRLLSPWLAAWSEGRELGFGALVVAVVALGYLLARRLAATAALRPTPGA